MYSWRMLVAWGHFGLHCRRTPHADIWWRRPNERALRERSVYRVIRRSSTKMDESTSSPVKEPLASRSRITKAPVPMQGSCAGISMPPPRSQFALLSRHRYTFSESAFSTLPPATPFVSMAARADRRRRGLCDRGREPLALSWPPAERQAFVSAGGAARQSPPHRLARSPP